MRFSLLIDRLRAELDYRIRSGEWTERGMARHLGVSQPHIHNVLKGIRTMSPDMADHVLGQLRIPMAALFSVEELEQMRKSRTEG